MDVLENIFDETEGGNLSPEDNDLNIEDEIGEIIKKLKGDTRDMESKDVLTKKLETLKERLRKEIQRMEKDLEKQKDSGGNSGFKGAEEETIGILKKKLKEADEFKI